MGSPPGKRRGALRPGNDAANRRAAAADTLEEGDESERRTDGEGWDKSDVIAGGVDRDERLEDQHEEAGQRQQQQVEAAPPQLARQAGDQEREADDAEILAEPQAAPDQRQGDQRE